MTDNTDMNKVCAGCILHEEHLSGRDNYVTCHGYLLKDIDCPCIGCLIKMMCKFTCDKLTERPWWQKYKYDRTGNEIGCPIEP